MRSSFQSHPTGGAHSLWPFFFFFFYFLLVLGCRFRSWLTLVLQIQNSGTRVEISGSLFGIRAKCKLKAAYPWQMNVLLTIDTFGPHTCEWKRGGGTWEATHNPFLFAFKTSRKADLRHRCVFQMRISQLFHSNLPHLWPPTQASSSPPVGRSRWGRGWRWTGSSTSESNPASSRYAGTFRNSLRFCGSHPLCPGGAQVYCADMYTNDPKEYVTLRSGQMDNYSEVYGHRCVCVRGERVEGPVLLGFLLMEGMFLRLFQVAEPVRMSV